MIQPAKPGEVVYFIQGRDGGPIKIGSSTFLGVRLRLRELRCGNPEDLIVTWTLPGGHALEKQLHRRFVEQRIRGEWFLPCPELAKLARAKSDNPPAAALRQAYGEGYDRGWWEGRADLSDQEIAA